MSVVTRNGEIRISVRGLVEFILRHGDIDNRHQGSYENAMHEGSRIHRMIQKRMGAEYEAEVSLKYNRPASKYVLIVEGRADGIIHGRNGVTIDEIKGTYRDVAKMKEPAPLHVAQAKCYAYMYGLKQNLDALQIRMTYCNIESEEIRYFYLDYTFEELKAWFNGLIEAYGKWADYLWEWREVSIKSIKEISFPFEYRDGQRDLVKYVYSTIYHKRKLFIEAPTGVGKTISTVFPALKAMGEGMGEKLFYLTAKTITRTVAEETLDILRKNGLKFKSIILTAKDKICFTKKGECNPESCPYAKGHYDRINDAMYAMLTKEESFNREKIEMYAKEYSVCPFEFCLDMSIFADGVIGDYNYLFDPHVSLKRFFSEGAGGEYIFLIDEAHNLLERGRDMYSAALIKEDFMELRREIKHMLDLKTSGFHDVEQKRSVVEGMDGSIKKSIFVREGYAELLVRQLEGCNKELLALKKECSDVNKVESMDGFTSRLIRLYSTMGDYLGEQEEFKLGIREKILNFYFDVGHFLEIYEILDEHYVKYSQMCDDNTFMLKLFCVNPGENLKKCMGKGRSTVLFSATFLPIQYYKELLGGETEDYEVYAKSVFDPEKRAIYVAKDVTSKYTRRFDSEYYNIARYIDEIVKNRDGNYMVFCPSHIFMNKIYDIYMKYFADEKKECIIQREYMSEEDREGFLNRFRGNEDCDLQANIFMEIEEEDEGTLIGFCVLGGIFSEGIDLKNDSLIGAIIVGTGLPQVSNERKILKEYFDGRGENGFDYAYRYPGMNKVLQAAGRVIRTAQDIGVIALLDERFLQPASRRLFPREWDNFETVDIESIAKRVERFWDSWL